MAIRDFFGHRPVLAFALRVLAWMSLTFCIWYLLAPWLNQPIAWGVHWATNLFWPDLLRETSVQGTNLILLPNLTVPLKDGRLALVPLTFNPLAYTWNLPLLLALILAVRPWRGLAWKLPLAYAALLPVHVWGILFKFLLQVNVLAHPEISTQIGMSDFGKTLVVLGNQFGYLMLPVISTALLWLAMNLDFVRSLQDAGKQTTSPVEYSV
jgi:hypothetical protein